MSTFILVCVVGISSQSVGVKHQYVLAFQERERLERIQAIEDDEYHANALSKFRRELCEKKFGQKPDLSWFQGGAL